MGYFLAKVSSDSINDFLAKYKFVILIILFVILLFVIFSSIFKICKTYKNKLLATNQYDTLTNAYSITGFDSIMNRVYTKIPSWIIVCFDIDNFKKINNDYGFDIGDKILISLVEKIKNLLDDKGIIGRVESNRFLLGIKADSINNIEEFLNKINSETKLVKLANYQIELVFTYAYYVSRNEAYHTAKSHAINAWIVAKRNKEKEIYDVENSIVVEEAKKETVQQEIVFTEKELDVYYTPVVNLQSGYVVQTRTRYKWMKMNGVTYDHESLLVLLKNDKEALDDCYLQVINKVTNDFNVIKNNNVDLCPVAVKMHSQVFSDTTFIEKMNNVIFTNGIRADLIVIEFDAKDIINSNTFANIANLLKSNGYGISIDNFAASKMNLDSILRVDVTSATLDSKYSRYGYNSNSSQRALNMFINGFADSLPIIKNVNTYDAMLQIKCFNSECNIEGDYFGKDLELYSYINLLQDLPFDLSEFIEEPKPEVKQEKVQEVQQQPTVIIQKEKDTIDKDSLEAIVLSIINKNKQYEGYEPRYNRYERYDYYDRRSNDVDIEATVRKVVHELFENKYIGENTPKTQTKEESVEDIVKRVMEQYTNNLEPKTVVVEKIVEKEKTEEESLASILSRLFPIQETKEEPVEEVTEPTPVPVVNEVVLQEELDEDDDEDDDDEEEGISEELQSQLDSKLDINQFEALMKQYMKDYNKNVIPEEYMNLSKEQTKWLTFMERINIASKETKSYYNMIKNAIMEYDGINNVIAKRYDTFKKGRVAIIKIAHVGKTLKVYLNLDPSKYPPAQFRHKDVSSTKKHVHTPFMVKVKSNLGLKRVLVLIQDTMIENGMEKKPNYKRCDFVARNRNLINKKLEIGIK